MRNPHPKTGHVVRAACRLRNKLLLAPVVWLTACAGVPTASFPLDALEKNAAKRRALSGTVRLTQSIDGKSRTVPGVLLVEWPNSLRLEVQDPVGSVLMLLVIHDKRFWLYRQDQKENLSGPLARLPMAFPVDAGDLVRAFLARPDFAPFRGAKGEGAEATVSRGGGREALRWSADFQPELWSRHEANGAFVKVEYEAFVFREGAHYPTRVRLTSGAAGGVERSALLVWNEWEPGVPARPTLFQIPQPQDFGRPTREL